jgi:F-type H+-transporting ATPase subunit a
MTPGAPLGGGSEQDPMDFVRHHALDEVLASWKVAGIDVPLLTKFSVMVVVSAVILLVLARLAVRRRTLVPSGALANFFEGVVIFVRDEMVRPAMGHHGDKFVPLFCTIFSFILVTNLAGMLPIPIVGGTATSNLALTGLLAAVVFLTSVVGGIAGHGVGGFMKGFIPPGLPLALRPMLFVLELVGFVIKHSVLAIRLFANMLAGHLVVGAFLALIFTAGKVSPVHGYAVAVPAVLFALFVYLLELLVCLLQAYVFTLLSVLFVGGTVHPEH